MNLFAKKIDVSNPSPYNRSDYVEVDLSHPHLEVPESLTFKLFRVWGDSQQERQEIPYQIDKIYGSSNNKRILTFFSENTPPSGDFDYEKKSASFLIEEGVPNELTCFKNDSLRVHHYYEKPRLGEPSDGFNLDWDLTREVRSVKLVSNELEVDFTLRASQTGTIDYSGCVTSISLNSLGNIGCCKEILAPYDYHSPHKWWGKIYKLVFFPLPWELKWFKQIPLLGKNYELVYSHSGSMRAVITVKSEDLKIAYDPRPYFSPFEVTCNLYRVLYIYPNNPFYIEEVFVLDKDKKDERDRDLFISCRPYFSSYLDYQQHGNPELKRFEHIPDYFSLWKRWENVVRGYGFASDSHIRGIEFDGDQVIWRLENSHHKKCINYFMFHHTYFHDRNFRVEDRFHTLGHSGWYEQIFKPLEVIPLQRIYPITTE